MRRRDRRADPRPGAVSADDEPAVLVRDLTGRLTALRELHARNNRLSALPDGRDAYLYETATSTTTTVAK